MVLLDKERSFGIASNEACPIARLGKIIVAVTDDEVAVLEKYAASTEKFTWTASLAIAEMVLSKTNSA